MFSKTTARARQKIFFHAKNQRLKTYVLTTKKKEGLKLQAPTQIITLSQIGQQ
jgi:hypothetical protein